MKYFSIIALFTVFFNNVDVNSQTQRLLVLNRGGDNILSVPYQDPGSTPDIEFSQNILAAYDFVVDPLSQKLYWTNTIAHQIIQSQTDLGGAGQPIDTDVAIAVDMEIDPSHNKLYWADNYRQSVFRSNLDGSEQESVSQDSISNISAIALFPAKNKLFYAELDSSKIWVSNLDGTGASILLEKDLGTPVRLLIDTVQEKLYWADDFQNRIERVNVDGTDREVVYQGSSEELPFGLLIDQFNGRLLWTDYGTNRVMAIKLDGSGIETLISSGIKDPVALLLVSESGQRLAQRTEGNQSVKIEPSVAVYPNPADNTVKISSLVYAQNIEFVQILDWAGKSVFSKDVNESTILVDISSLAPGQYMYSVTVVGKQIAGVFSIVR